MIASFWVLAWAGDYYDLSFVIGSVLSCALNHIVFDRNISRNVNFEIIQYVVFIILRKIYQFICRIHSIVDTCELKREHGPTNPQSC